MRPDLPRQWLPGPALLLASLLRLPGFEPAGSFGQAELRSPYGVWLHEVAPGELEVSVTDSYKLGKDFDVPPESELDERVRRYDVAFDRAGRVVARHRGAFGDTGRGALGVVESLAGDPVAGVLLVADEAPLADSTLRIYRLDGSYTGRDVPPTSMRKPRAPRSGTAVSRCINQAVAAFDLGDVARALGLGGVCLR